MSCIKEDVAEQEKSIQQQAVNLPETEQRGVDSCLHHHHRKMMEDKEEEEEWASQYDAYDIQIKHVGRGLSWFVWLIIIIKRLILL